MRITKKALQAAVFLVISNLYEDRFVFPCNARFKLWYLSLFI
jgi:hypothetical protein